MRWWLALLAFGVVSSGVPALADAQTSVLQSWDGDGTARTSAFHIDGAFELRWTASGAFQAEVSTVDGSLVQPFGNQTAGQGSFDVQAAGDYFIKTQAQGPWHLQLVEVADPAPATASESTPVTIPQPALQSEQPTAASDQVEPTNAPSPLTGPSYPCPQPMDPLAQLICSQPELSLLDLRFVQTYQALRQQVGAAGQPELRQESIAFGLAVRSSCGIALAQSPSSSAPPPPEAPASAMPCVSQAYSAQKALWDSRLQGAAAEEAARPLEEQADLQRQLQALGFLPPTAAIDAVFGSGTRLAIIAWQIAKGRQATGLLGNDDAAALMQDNAASSQEAPLPPTPAPQASIPPAANLQTQTVTPAAPVLAPGLPAEQTGSGEDDWKALVSQAAAQGLAVVYKNDASGCSVMTTMDDPTMGRLADQYIAASTTDASQQQSWRDHKFTVGMLLMQAEFSAPMVKRFYADFPTADNCQFELATNGYDDFGQPSPKPIYTFSLSRSIYSRINWSHFIPTNLDKIATTFAISADAQAELKKEGGS